MRIEEIISKNVAAIIKKLYNKDIEVSENFIQKTKEEFDGDITLVVFSFAKIIGGSPEKIAEEIGTEFKNNLSEISDFNVIKGFLNLKINDNYWLEYFADNNKEKNYGFSKTKKEETIMIEYCSPNTNKPLHLGHIRNCFLGHSISEILKANGSKVIKANLVNDRGIHICKTMLAWQKWGSDDAPEHNDIKGDHFVGNYYVLFEKNYKSEIDELVAKGISEEEAKKQAGLILQAQELLKKWEDRDIDTINLWRKMNNWVYAGFEETYTALDISFDKVYHESETYITGKKIIEDGLKKGVFFEKEDGSVWIDLTADGYDEKLLLRADKTSVYITQDLGTALERTNEFNLSKMIYIVGNEQDYHFAILKIILKKLGYNWADNIFHLSYGMVELPSGKMKSREGKVVDADDLINEMLETARNITKELGKIEGMSFEEAQDLYRKIGLGALKYFILKIDPKKNMLFSPDESIDFNGNTAPFIQYTFARIQSILRKSESMEIKPVLAQGIALNEKEKELIKLIYYFPQIIKQAAEEYSPAVIANYAYTLAKEYNQFYHDYPILKAENESSMNFRLILSAFIAEVIKSSLKLLGIDVPYRM
ncbi:MAG: arginine--tRNA ligase [Bacteroidales bacterium]